MLIICVGTDIYPALSLAYEEAEVDIMTRKPRKQSDHLVTARLLTHAYGQMGEIATAGGFFTYFITMAVYGFDYSLIFFLLSVNAVNPIVNGAVDTNFNGPYTYDPNAVNFGNTNIPANSQDLSSDNFNTNFPDWISTLNNKLDLRGWYLVANDGKQKTLCSISPGTYCQAFNWPGPDSVLSTVSTITNMPVAYTTEAIFYAQSAYFVTIVMVQWSNVFACKSRKVSFTYSAPNVHMFGGIALETFLFIFFLYIPGVNNIFGGRHLPFFLLGIPGLAFSIILLVWE